MNIVEAGGKKRQSFENILLNKMGVNGCRRRGRGSNIYPGHACIGELLCHFRNPTTCTRANVQDRQRRCQGGQVILP